MARDEIDPRKYAGEGWYATEEYPTRKDIDDKFVRGDVGREGDYYPPAAPKRKRR